MSHKSHMFGVDGSIVENVVYSGERSLICAIIYDAYMDAITPIVDKGTGTKVFNIIKARAFIESDNCRIYCNWVSFNYERLVSKYKKEHAKNVEEANLGQLNKKRPIKYV